MSHLVGTTRSLPLNEVKRKILNVRKSVMQPHLTGDRINVKFNFLSLYNIQISTSANEHREVIKNLA